MIHHRTWSEWFRLRWVAQVAIHYSDDNVEIIDKEVGRFYPLAILRLWFFESRMRDSHTNVEVNGWLTWKV